MSESAPAPKIQFRCEHCKEPIVVAAGKAGQEIGCPKCMAALIVPEKSAGASGGIRSVNAKASGLRRATAPADPVAKVEAQEMRVAAAPRPEAQEEAAAPAVRTREVGERVATEARGEARARRYKEPAPKKAGSKLPLVLGAGAVVLVVLGYVGLTVSQNMARAKLQTEIDNDAKQAQASLSQGEIDEAVKYANLAKTKLKTAEGMDPALKTGWEKTFKKVGEYDAQMKAVDDLLKEAAKAPGKARDQLLQKKLLLEKESAEAKPILSKVVLAIDEVTKIETEQALAALRKDADKAEKAYLDGNVEEALKSAQEIQAKIAADEKLKDKDLQAKLDALRRNGDRYHQARGVRQALQGNYAETVKNLEEQAKKLDSAKPEDKPILAYIEKAKAEVKEEEKKANRITPKDLDALNKLARVMASKDPGLVVGDSSPSYGVKLSFEGQDVGLAMQHEGENSKLTLQADGRVMSVDEKLSTTRPGVVLRQVQGVAKAMREASVPPGGVWRLMHESPYPAAQREADGKSLIFYNGKLYTGEAVKRAVSEEDARKELAEAAEDLALGIEGDQATPEDVRNAVAVVVRGAYKPLAKNDYLTSEFCRRVLGDGYLEDNLPDLAKRMKDKIDRFKKIYAEILKPVKMFEGASADGDELEERVSYEAQVVFESYDKKNDVTSYGIKVPSDERPLLFSVSDFPGKVEDFPKDPKPKLVRMCHAALGAVATWDPATGKLEYDNTAWNLAALLTTFPNLPRVYGSPQWAFPPHAALFNELGDPISIMTPTGKVDFPSFSAAGDVPERRAAEDAYLDTLAKVLNGTGYLNLYYIYFHQYALDSPVTSLRHLLGSSKHSGDIHQTVYESVERKMGARCLGDCDDLAELFQVVTRRQGKLSYVMALPGHAACGWVDKDGDLYRMQFLQTGPPLIVEGNDLDRVVEAGSRLHDHDKTMRFDPKSLGFLFRFAGEPTRTPYWLSTRMFVDGKYGETMERVQSYWHFHLYALGIQTMEDMIAKGDRVPENCTELSGLYGQVREIKKSIQWTTEALKQLGQEEILSRLSETSRIGMMYRRDRDNENAYKAILPAVQELKRLYGTQESTRYISSRMEYASLLTSVKKPWEAYDLVERDAVLFTRQHPKVPFAPGGVLVGIYGKMQEMIRKEGYTPTAAESTMTGRCEQILKWFIDNKLIMEDDDFNDIMRKYATLGRYYAAKLGQEKLLEELKKDGPWPAGERNHRDDRRNPDIEEDWKWIRMAVLSYVIEIGDALDPEEPPESWRKDEAIKLAEAMDRAAQRAVKFGSLSSTENVLFTTRVVHAFLTKNWKEWEDVLKIVKERNWARLTADVAEAFGGAARFVTPQEFASAYRLFTKYVDTKAPYFSAVYEAYRAEGYEHARLAAQIAVEKWPDNDMKREAKYLDELIKARQADKAEKDKASKPGEKK
ncbi:MAG: hypothetical protein KIS92_19335 [Planctomycetota bacterium]|nr:hypothetical protein [Planctomycetota bacterium]